MSFTTAREASFDIQALVACPIQRGLVVMVSSSDVASYRIQVQHRHGNIAKFTFTCDNKRCAARVFADNRQRISRPFTPQEA